MTPAQPRVVLGLDFGGTKLAAGIVDLQRGAVVLERRALTPAGSAAPCLDAMIAMAATLLEQSPLPVDGVGINFGGLVDAGAGVILRSHHVAGWDNRPLARDVSAKLHLPTALDNDANGQALAEWRFGAGSGTQHFAYVNLGTGLGGGLVLSGRLWPGAHSLAGEFGHFPLQPGGPQCSCGRSGCFEALCAGPAVARRLQEAIKQSPSRHPNLTPTTLYQEAETGDAVAAAVIEDILIDLARGLSIIQLSIDPECIALGGGAAEYTSGQFRQLNHLVRSLCPPIVSEHVRIEPAQLGTQSGILGAAAIFLASTDASGPTTK